MADATTHSILQCVPGVWTLRATTFSRPRAWARGPIRVRYRIADRRALSLRSEWTSVGFDGRPRTVHGVDRFRPASGEFRWRGEGTVAAVSVVWLLASVNSQATIAVIRTRGLLLWPAGVHIVARRDGDVAGLPERVRAASDFYGLSEAELERLRWLVWSREP